MRRVCGAGSQIDGPADLGSPAQVTRARSPVAAASGASQLSTVNSVPVAFAPLIVTTPDPSVGKDSAVPEAPPSGTLATRVLPHTTVGSATEGRGQLPAVTA